MTVSPTAKRQPHVKLVSSAVRSTKSMFSVTASTTVWHCSLVSAGPPPVPLSASERPAMLLLVGNKNEMREQKIMRDS